jgi:hypothetical protein
MGSSSDPELEQTLESVREALRDLRYGTITVVVHDGTVVQIDRTEKLRVPRVAPLASGRQDR